MIYDLFSNIIGFILISQTLKKVFLCYGRVVELLVFSSWKNHAHSRNLAFSFCRPLFYLPDPGSKTDLLLEV